MTSWTAFKAILNKDMKAYYLKPPNISWGIIFPLAWTVMLLIRTQSPLDVRILLPGVMAMAVLFGTTSMLAVTITFERRSRSFERLLLAPIDINLLILAKTAGAIVFGMFNALVPVILGFLFTDLSGVSWLPMFIAVMLMAVTSTFLGLFIAVSVSEVFEAQTFSNFFRFPMVFLCGLFVPVTALPVPLQAVARVIPLTYGVDVLRGAIGEPALHSMMVNLVVLIGFAVILFVVSMRNVRRRWLL